jgi:molecular chaperone DnaK
MKRLAVYDLGGGTFDVSIVQSQQGVVEVLASHGDTQLGGDDFDELLLKHICDRFQAEHEIDLRTNLVSRSRVLNAAEAAKRQLSSQPFARVDEEFIAEKEGRALHLSMELERHEYERLIRPLVDRTMDSVQQALTDAKLNASQIDKVILVGGSTRTPMIQEMLRDRFGQAPHQEVNPDLCVAMGAGLQGAIIAGKQVNAVLIDITPHSLGIRCVSSSGFFGQPEFMYSIIIPRNTSLPATASEVYYTMADNQEKVEIRVYQGENKHVEANHLVNGFFIEGLSKVPAGNAIIVQFRLSLDGTLVVTAKERLTGLQKQVTLQNALARLQGQNLVEARERLEELWRDEETAEPTKPSSGAEIPQIVPVVTESTLASHRESFQARAILEKAEGLLGKVLREDQAEVIGKMDVLRKALAEGNSKSISMASNHLADLLFYLEDA